MGRRKLLAEVRPLILRRRRISGTILSTFAGLRDHPPWYLHAHKAQKHCRIAANVRMGEGGKDRVMNDNSELRDWYLALTDSDKQIFLALVSNHLTIHGREFGLHPASEQQARGFKGLNELQHQISGHIVGLGVGRDRYPDETLWQILAEKAAAYGLSPHLTASLEFAPIQGSLEETKISSRSNRAPDRIKPQYRRRK
jgi:hypothetical protein